MTNTLPNTAPQYLQDLHEKYQQTSFANSSINVNTSNKVFVDKPGMEQSPLGNFEGFGELDSNFIVALVNAYPKLEGDLTNKVQSEGLAEDNAERDRILAEKAENDRLLAEEQAKTDATTETVPTDANGNPAPHGIYENGVAKPAPEETTAGAGA